MITPSGAAPDMIRIAAATPRSYSAGPGARYELWMQGCTRGCPGCFNPHMQDPAGGREVAIGPLAREIAAAPGIEGLSLSGGEPFAQAAAGAALVAHVRTLNPELTILAYSGFTHEELSASSDCGQVALLQQLDYLIDGPYVAALNLPGHDHWRGSSNQRFMCLTERARARPQLLAPQVTARMEQSRVEISGFPSDDLMQQVRQALRSLGFEVSDEA